MRVSPRTHVVCTLPDCDEPYRAKGYCSKHYQRLRNYGSVDDPRPSPEELFWQKVCKTATCWEWIGAKDSHGYGAVTIAGRMIGAHRVVYEWNIGSIPEGMMLDHTCHNSDPLCPGGKRCYHRACVNPAHLEPVTNQQNQLRAVARFARA